MKKHIITALLSIVLILVLTACGKEEGSNIDSTTPTPIPQADGSTSILAESEPIKNIVSIGQYKGIEVTLLDLVVTDEEVERELYVSLIDNAVEIGRNTVEKYDIVVIDFEGKKDGVAFEGGAATNYELMIGSSSFIPGFEEGLLGAKVGETIELPLKFPEAYGNADLAGQDVVFTVTIHGIKVVPTLTDAFISENTEFATLKEYTDDIRATLQKSYDDTIESQMESDIFDALVANSEYHMDLSSEITAYAANTRSAYESYAEMYGVDLETYLLYMFGMTMEAFEQELPKSAEQVVKRYYALLAVAEAEGMTVSEEEYSAFAEQMMIDYGYDTLEALEKDYPKKNLENSLLYERSIDLVIENAIRK